jgi:hypothetical protein
VSTISRSIEAQPVREMPAMCGLKYRFEGPE